VLSVRVLSASVRLGPGSAKLNISDRISIISSHISIQSHMVYYSSVAVCLLLRAKIM
jgi:hypothetical protein